MNEKSTESAQNPRDSEKAVSMTSNPSVSVIIPVYNSANSLETSIRSALSQKGVLLELVCVDDGSEDGSLRVLRDFASEDGRIRVISQPNSGSGAARNRGLNAAKGEWVAFLDADDCYPTPHALLALIDAAQDCGLSAAGGNMDWYTADGVFRDRYLKEGLFTDGSISYADFQGHAHFQRYAFRRDLLIRNGISFPNYLRFQDPPFLVRTLLAAGEIATTSEVVYCYMFSPEHVNWNSRKLVDRYRGMEDVLRFSAKNNLARLHGTVSQAIRDEELLYKTLLQEENLALDALRSVVRSVDERLLGDLESHRRFVAKLEALVKLRESDRAKSDSKMTRRLHFVEFWKGAKGILWNHLPGAMRQVKSLRDSLQSKRRKLV